MDKMSKNIERNTTELVNVLNSNKTCMQLMNVLCNRAKLKGLSPQQWETVKSEIFTRLYFMIPAYSEQFKKDLYEELRNMEV